MRSGRNRLGRSVSVLAWRTIVKQSSRSRSSWRPGVARCPPAALGRAGPAPMQTLVTTMQAMAIRIQDVLDARAAPHSPAMARRLANAAREWRLVVRELLAQSATEPEHLNATDLRARLGRKLQEIERLTEQAIDEDPDFHAHLDLNENSYRLLGAYRGLSESLVNFAQAAHAVDWSRLREPRC
jgi:hypothetical protein